MYFRRIFDWFDCIRFAENKERFCKNILENEAYQQLDEDAYDVIARYTNVLGQKEIMVEDKIEGGKVNMCKAMQELMADSKAAGRTEGRAEGRTEERTEGRTEERRDVLIELLRGLGSLSDSLWERIRQECDLQVLRDWTRLAVRVDSVQEFEAKIQ